MTIWPSPREQFNAPEHYHLGPPVLDPCPTPFLKLGRESSARPTLAPRPKTAPASPATTVVPLHGGGRNFPSHDQPRRTP